MSPELVCPNLNVWVHSHGELPQRGILVGHMMTSDTTPYLWVTVNVNGRNSDYEIGRVTIDGNKKDLAYYHYNGKKLLYKIQAADLF